MVERSGQIPDSLAYRFLSRILSQIPLNYESFPFPGAWLPLNRLRLCENSGRVLCLMWRTRFETQAFPLWFRFCDWLSSCCPELNGELMIVSNLGITQLSSNLGRLLGYCLFGDDAGFLGKFPSAEQSDSVIVYRQTRLTARSATIMSTCDRIVDRLHLWWSRRTVANETNHCLQDNRWFWFLELLFLWLVACLHKFCLVIIFRCRMEVEILSYRELHQHISRMLIKRMPHQSILTAD